MELDLQLYIAVGVLGAVCLLLLMLVIVLFVQVSSLNNKLDNIQNAGKLRVQKLKMTSASKHAFHNPALLPDEELSRRGYSMYQPSEPDVESQRSHHERSHPGPTFVDELTRELDNRQRNGTPPFLLSAINENKKKNHFSHNPAAAADNRQLSDTNPNFIY